MCGDRQGRAGAWLSTGSLEMTVPHCGSPFLAPSGVRSADKEGQCVFQAPLGDSLCDLGHIIHHLWAGRPWGMLRAAQPSGDKPPGWGHHCSPQLGPGRLAAGAGRMHRQGNRSSSQPETGSVLNCLLHEARAEHGRWPEGRGRRAPAPRSHTPHPVPRWTGSGGVQTPGAGEGAHESVLVVADSVTDTEGPGQSFRCQAVAPRSKCRLRPTSRPGVALAHFSSWLHWTPPPLPSKTSLHTQLCPHLEAF